MATTPKISIRIVGVVLFVVSLTSLVESLPNIIETPIQELAEESNGDRYSYSSSSSSKGKAAAKDSELEIIPPPIKNIDQSYTWGTVRKGDELVAEKVIIYPIELGVRILRSENVYCDPGTKISKIEFVDRWRNGKNAKITKIVIHNDAIITITIDFEQYWSMGTAYSIKIWGKTPDYT